jgi:MFS family permease
MSEIALVAGQHGSGNYGQAYGLFNVAFSSGFLIGPLWGGYVTEKAGWNIMVGSLAGLAGASAIPVFIWSGGPWRDAGLQIQRIFKKRERQNREDSNTIARL